MKLQILKGEYLFSEQGTHVLDERGFAVQAQEDCECEVSEEHYERVSQLVAADRQFRLGLPLEEMPPNESPEEVVATAEQPPEEMAAVTEDVPASEEQPPQEPTVEITVEQPVVEQPIEETVQPTEEQAT